MTKRHLTIALIIVIGALSVLSFFSIALAGDNHNFICPASVMTSTSCHNAAHELARIMHHMTLIGLLTQGNISFVLFAAPLLLLLFMFSPDIFAIRQFFYKNYFSLIADKIFNGYNKLIRWLTLRNNSDYAVVYQGT